MDDEASFFLFQIFSHARLKLDQMQLWTLKARLDQEAFFPQQGKTERFPGRKKNPQRGTSVELEISKSSSRKARSATLEETVVVKPLRFVEETGRAAHHPLLTGFQWKCCPTRR